MRIISVLLSCLLLLAAGCVHNPHSTKDTALSSNFFSHLKSPARFLVRMHPVGATRMLDGRRIPIRLADCLSNALEAEHLLATDTSFPTTYAIVVEKHKLFQEQSAFSRSFREVMQGGDGEDGSFLMEISIEEVGSNAAGEAVFGKRIALFTTPLLRPEEEIAADIVRIILEELNL